MIYTTNFASAKKAKGLRVSIVRRQLDWTAGLYDKQVLSLAPSTSLLMDYKYKGLSWEGYTSRYMKELLDTRGIEDLGTLMRDNEDITLMCYCGKNANCHRHILRGILNKIGVECKEL